MMAGWRGVLLSQQGEIRAGAVVVTTGTFLGGVLFSGLEQRPGGRAGTPPSNALALRLRALGLVTGRLKTGTPPRLDGRTIDWSRVGHQPGDDHPAFFSWRTHTHHAPQVACGDHRDQ